MHGKRIVSSLYLYPGQTSAETSSGIYVQQSGISVQRTMHLNPGKGLKQTSVIPGFECSVTTGEMVPDETARVPVYECTGVKKAKWPDADFVVGNPPFIGGKDIRAWHGDGYALALRTAYDDVPDSADFVMYWWQKAAELARAGKLRRFGLVTTNSITQVFDRKVVAQNLNAAKDPLSLVFAIPNHSWLKALSSEEHTATRHAAVRIAMRVGERGEHKGHPYRVTSEGTHALKDRN
jgi:hypothetical protein